MCTNLVICSTQIYYLQCYRSKVWQEAHQASFRTDDPINPVYSLVGCKFRVIPSFKKLQHSLAHTTSPPPFSIFKVRTQKQILRWYLSDLTQEIFSIFKDSCNQTGSTQIIQNNFLISRSITLMKKSPILFNVTYLQIPDKI